MWITGFGLRATRSFYPQAALKFSTVPGWGLWRKFCRNFLHRLSFHIQQGLWINFGVKKGGIYRLELTLAVMSRMLFCRLVSPFFSWVSTLRML